MASGVLQLLILAEAYGKAGQAAEEMDVLERALSLVEGVGLRYLEAEVWRLKGELLADAGNDVDAAACFEPALEAARRQGARLWELMATVSLARLRRAQGRVEEGRTSWLPSTAGSPRGSMRPTCRQRGRC